MRPLIHPTESSLAGIAHLAILSTSGNSRVDKLVLCQALSLYHNCCTAFSLMELSQVAGMVQQTYSAILLIQQTISIWHYIRRNGTVDIMS